MGNDSLATPHPPYDALIAARRCAVCLAPCGAVVDVVPVCVEHDGPGSVEQALAEARAERDENFRILTQQIEVINAGVRALKGARRSLELLRDSADIPSWATCEAELALKMIDAQMTGKVPS